MTKPEMQRVAGTKMNAEVNQTPVRGFAMVGIRFPANQENAGLGVIIYNGMVEYTETNVYRVPPYSLDLLRANHIPYEVVEPPELNGKI